MDSFRDSLAGGLGGCGCAVAGQPFDTVKVKQQTYPHVYPTAVQTLTKTLREEGGLRGLYAGCGAAVGSNMAENAVLFVCYERCLDLVRWVTGEQSRDGLSVTKQAFAGSLASVASSVAINPFERIKCKMQVQGQQKHQSIGGRLRSHLNQCMIMLLVCLFPCSHWSVAGNIIKEEGVRFFFRGLTSTWAREVPGYFFFFGGYNASRRLLCPHSSGDGQSDLSVWRLTVAGGLAGCCFWTSIFPTDVVKSRVQVCVFVCVCVCVLSDYCWCRSMKVSLAHFGSLCFEL